jgi:general secretion pathway protein G
MKLAVAIVAAAVLAVAVPNFVQSQQRSRQKRTMADMRTIATAWEARAVDHKVYGNGHIPAARLAQALQPTYIRTMPQRDGWGNEFDFRANDASQSYSIRSFGSDGKPDGGAAGAFEVRRFDLDLIFGNGTFVQYPEGT